MQEIAIQKLSLIRGAKFVSATYTAKNSGEIARYTLAMGVNYVEACKRDITELEIRLRDAKGIPAIIIQKQIESLLESIQAHSEGRAHKDYTKPGLYIHVCPGVKLSRNDFSFELWGFQHTRKVKVPGFYPRMTDRAKLKAETLAGLKTRNFKTLCFDSGHLEKIRVNGEEIILD